MDGQSIFKENYKLKQNKCTEEDNYSNDYVYSDQQQDISDSQIQSAPQISGKNSQLEQKWEDLPLKEKGEIQYVTSIERPSYAPEDSKDLNVQKQEGLAQKSNKNKQKCQQIKFEQKQYHSIKQEKIFYNYKAIYAAYELLKTELVTLVKPNQGYIKFNPYENKESIIVYYFDDKKLKNILNKVDKHINSLQFLPMTKSEAEYGLQMSNKYYENLLRQKITFFKDTTQNYKSVSYYICGKVKQQILYQKLKQIKNTTFCCVNLFKFSNTRSYKAIISKIFDLPEIHHIINQKFSAKQIQVGYLKNNFPEIFNSKKNQIMAVLTYQGCRKITNVKQLQQTIQAYIQTFAVFCFSFLDYKDQKINKYIPKIDKVSIFFIQERNLQKPIAYIYIIVKKSDFQDVKQSIITQIQRIDLKITRRRFFKNLYPTRQQVSNQQYFIFQYPKHRPYSWTYAPRQRQKFDWVSHLKL